MEQFSQPKIYWNLNQVYIRSLKNKTTIVGSWLWNHAHHKANCGLGITIVVNLWKFGRPKLVLLL